MAFSNGMEYFGINAEVDMEHFSQPSNKDLSQEDEAEMVSAAIDRLPSINHHNFAVIQGSCRGPRGGVMDSSIFEVIDVRKLDRRGRKRVLRKALATNDQDNYNLLAGIKSRFDQ